MKVFGFGMSQLLNGILLGVCAIMSTGCGTIHSTRMWVPMASGLDEVDAVRSGTHGDDAYATVAERDATLVVRVNKSNTEVDADDPCAAFQSPDDLMWQVGKLAWRGADKSAGRTDSGPIAHAATSWVRLSDDRQEPTVAASGDNVL